METIIKIGPLSAEKYVLKFVHNSFAKSHMGPLRVASSYLKQDFYGLAEGNRLKGAIYFLLLVADFFLFTNFTIDGIK